MEARLVEFARLLRDNGVRVSPAEEADAARALALVGVAEREAFRAALRATLVKRAADLPLFEALFALWASGLGRALERLERGVLADLETLAGLEPAERAAALAGLQAALAGLSPLAQAVLTGDPGSVARLLEGALRRLDLSALDSPAQLGYYGRRLLAAAGVGEAARELDGLAARLRARGLGPRALELVAGKVRAALDALEAVAREHVAYEQRARAEARRRRSLAPGGFAALGPGELERLELAVRRLAERLRARLAARERDRRGALDVRRTLRRNAALGGLPARLAFRRRPPQRPDVVVLCDLSDSVRHVSRLMLVFLHTLQGLFTRVRSFVFVGDVGEVTEAFRAERDPSRAVDRAFAGQLISLAGHSNYGRALRTFHDRFAGAVTRRTTVIVIGDGRTNYHPPQAWVLDALRRRARRVVWICPEERWSWGQGDSEMPLYAARVERVAVVNDLESLAGVADALVPRRAGRR